MTFGEIGYHRLSSARGTWTALVEAIVADRASTRRVTRLLLIVIAIRSDLG